MINLFYKILFLFVSTLLCAGFLNVTNSFANVKWRMQSTWGSQVAINGESAVYFSNKVKSLSDGKVQLRFHEPNALVPSLEVWDAVKDGDIESGYTTPGYHAGRIPAVSFFTAIPFGPHMSEYLGWFEYGGGKQLKDEIYGQYGLYSLNCLATAPETAGWFKRRINSVEDLRGMKIRFFGLGAMVMNKLGVSTKLLAGGDIYPALEKGVIDATEFSMPTHDLSYGFYQLAKFNYFPGWHQQTSVGELLVNKRKWNRLSSYQKEIINTACRDTILWAVVRSDAKQVPAMRELAKKGVTFVRWSDRDLAKFKRAWNDVVEERSSMDPLFAAVARSFTAFRKEYSIWMKHGYLN